MSNSGLLLFLVLCGVVVYLVWDTYFTGGLEEVRSTYDGRDYTVQSMPDKVEAANLLAQIREGLIKLVEHLKRIQSDDERTKSISDKFQPDKISEGKDDTRYTSYSVNKGERIVFCLRSRDKKKELMDLNTMMFVALHELAHIGTKSVGHTDEFWKNFRWLLEEAVQIGVYKEQDFKSKPKPYCGITITDSPLQH